jgi:hypothetical protein
VSDPRDRRPSGGAKAGEMSRADVERALRMGGRMKSVAALCFALSFTACATDSDSNEERKLSKDAHFIEVFPGYTSPEDCMARSPDPRGCRFTISLCHSGRAAQRIADIISSGTYVMIDGVAHVTFDDGRTLDFEVATRMDLADPNATWIRDVNNLHETQDFDTISCD